MPPRTLTDTPATYDASHVTIPATNGGAFELHAAPGHPLALLYRVRGCSYCGIPDVTVSVDVTDADLARVGLLRRQADRATD